MYEKSNSDLLIVVNEAFFACGKAAEAFDHDSREYAKLRKAQTEILEVHEKLAEAQYGKK